MQNKERKEKTNKKKMIFEDDIKMEISELEKEYRELTKSLKEYKGSIYEKEDWDRRTEIIRRISILRLI